MATFQLRLTTVPNAVPRHVSDAEEVERLAGWVRNAIRARKAPPAAVVLRPERTEVIAGSAEGWRAPSCSTVARDPPRETSLSPMRRTSSSSSSSSCPPSHSPPYSAFLLVVLAFSLPVLLSSPMLSDMLSCRSSTLKVSTRVVMRCIRLAVPGSMCRDAAALVCNDMRWQAERRAPLCDREEPDGDKAGALRLQLTFMRYNFKQAQLKTPTVTTHH